MRVQNYCIHLLATNPATSSYMPLQRRERLNQKGPALRPISHLYPQQLHSCAKQPCSTDPPCVSCSCCTAAQSSKQPCLSNPLCTPCSGCSAAHSSQQFYLSNPLCTPRRGCSSARSQPCLKNPPCIPRSGCTAAQRLCQHPQS